MVDATYIENNRIHVVQNDKTAFDTAHKSITLFPDSYRIVHNNFNIHFPNLIMGRNYYRFQNNFGTTTCSLWSTLIWQEWGPDEGHHNEFYYSQAPQNSRPGPTTRNLPQTWLGSVPASSNYLDIRVKLNRNWAPKAFLETEPPVVFFPEGEWISLTGGSCTCEYFDPMIRHFDIVRSGNDIYLRRFQSVKNSNAPHEQAYGGNNADINNNMSGWSRSQGTSYSEGDVSARSNNQIITLIDYKPFDNNGNKRPSGTNPCQGPFPDISSNYIGDIIITPGKYQ